MVLKTGTGVGQTQPRVLCLDVWLGPMDGTRHFAPPARETVVRIGRRRTDEKRGVTNDLVLAQAEGVSGFHAELRARGESMKLKDLNSTNGTFAAGQRISGEVDLQAGDTVVLSTTLLHVSFKDEAHVATVPSEEEISGSVPFQSLHAAAARVAVQRNEAYVDTRHLAQALIESGDEGISNALSAAKFDRERAVAELWQGAFLPENLHWVRRFVTLSEGPAASSGKPVFSPAVRSLFFAALTRLSGYGDAEATAYAARSLFSQLYSSRGLIGAWLADRGVRPESVPSSRRGGQRKTAARPARSVEVAGAAEDPTVRQAPAEKGATPSLAPRVDPGPAAEETAAARAPVAASSTSPAPVGPKSADSSDTKRYPRLTGDVSSGGAERFAVPTTGDSILDQRARAIAAELEEAAALYRFSTPEDRRTVMRTLVTRALSAVAPQNRARILAQIRVQFPVTAAPPVESSDETTKLRARVRELEQRLADMAAERERTIPPQTRVSASGGQGWRAVLDPPDPKGSPDLEAMRATVAFAKNLERFLLGMIQTSMTPGDGTMSFRLPGYRYNLGSVFQSLHEGKAVDLGDYPDYLRDLERWQVAILAAHHASPRIWFDRLWKKISPTVIENAQAKGGSWKLGGQASDWWNRYKEVVRGLSPDVVQDQVLQTAAKTAQEEFDKLSKLKK